MTAFWGCCGARKPGHKEGCTDPRRVAAPEHDQEVLRILGELAGAASMCWEPTPTGVFDSTLAQSFVMKAYAEIESAMQGKDFS